MPVRIERIQGVVFDLDDTLYPEQSYVFSGFEAVGKWLRGQLSCGLDPAARMRELFVAGERRHVFDRVLAELGCRQAAAMVPRMLACYRSHTPAIRLHEDAEQALQRWQGRFRLGLLTDGVLGVQQLKVAALGLAGRLEPLVFTDRWGQAFWKPHPRGFEHIQEVWGLAGAACVYLADNPQKDFLAPRRLSWRTVRVRRPEGVYAQVVSPPGGEAELEVRSLGELELSS